MKKKIVIILFSVILGAIVYKSIFPTKTSAVYWGESETWKIEGIEISTKDRFNFGEGMLYMKDKTEYLADYFKLSAHVVLKHEEERESRMHEYEIKADNLPVLWEDDVLDIAVMDTGQSSPLYLTRFWKPVTLNNIKQVYFVVQWKGKNDTELKEEKIILTQVEK